MLMMFVKVSKSLLLMYYFQKLKGNNTTIKASCFHQKVFPRETNNLSHSWLSMSVGFTLVDSTT